MDPTCSQPEPDSDLALAIELLAQLAKASRRLVEGIDSSASEGALLRTADRCDELEERYRQLGLDTGQLTPGERQVLTEALQEAGRWSALAQEAVNASSRALTDRAREVSDVRRRLSFYGAADAGGQSCDIAG